MKPLAIIALGILSAAACASAAPKFFGSVSHRLLSSNGIVDSVEVTTYVGNEGSTPALSPQFPKTYPIVAIGTDTLSVLRNHAVATLDAGFYVSFKDTLRILAIPTALHCWVDPIKAWGDSTPFDNVTSYIIDYHRDQALDTIFIYVHDTVRVYDSVATPSALVGSAPLARISAVAGALYDVSGRKVWEGVSASGVIPRGLTLATGVHLFVQGAVRRLVQVR